MFKAHAPWHGEYQEIYAGNGVIITELQNAPDKLPPGDYHSGWVGNYDTAVSSLIDAEAGKNPGSEVPDWTVRDLSGTIFSIRYTPTNTSARANLGKYGGLLATDRLNGCVAVAAALRDSTGGDIEAYLSHYDPESVRKKDDENESLKVSAMLASFAGSQAVKVAVAYARSVDNLRSSSPDYDPEDYPIQAIIDGCKELASGSSVLLVPYDTKKNPPGELTTSQANNIYVGTGANVIHFGWNGYTLQVGEEERLGDAGRQEVREQVADFLGNDPDYSDLE